MATHRLALALAEATPSTAEALGRPRVGRLTRASRGVQAALVALVLLPGCGVGAGEIDGRGADADVEPAAPSHDAGAAPSPDAGQPSPDAGPPSPDAGATPVDAGSDGGSSGSRFPRLGAYPIGSPHNYDSPGFRDVARKYHVVVVTHWPGWQSTRGMTMAEVMKDVKARSTVGTKLFTYVINNEMPVSQQPSDAFHPVWQKLNAEKWWLYPTASSGSPVTSTYPGTNIVNNTLFGKTDSNGKNWIQWKTDFDYGFNVVGDAKNAANPYVDGFFMDNVFWRPRVDGDWDRDGTSDSQSSPAVQRWMREGYKSYFDYVRSRWPGSIQIGNIADWGAASAVLDPLDQVLEGGVMESMIGESWSFESWGGFDQMMAAYRKMMDACRAPKLIIFGHDNWVEGDYRAMRYGLASTLMDDAYFYINDSHMYDPSRLKWFDEFEVDLGYPTQARQEAAWSQGVWRRDFDNGIVLVNPKGNGARTVDLGGTFRKLSGTQDPVTNDGATVTRVTLADRDGVILRR